MSRILDFRILKFWIKKMVLTNGIVKFRIQQFVYQILFLLTEQSAGSENYIKNYGFVDISNTMIVKPL